MASTQQQIDPSRRVLKILSYNVHSCIGTDRRLDPARIADVIAALSPDIIGLQELDVGRRRTGGADQAEIIASLLEMKFHFHAALHVAEERYGDAILTTLPMQFVKGGMLPSRSEQRGALWVEVTVGDKQVQVFNTHLGLPRRDRVQQMTTLLGPSWIGNPESEGKSQILIGDLNSIGQSAAYRQVARRMKDVQLQTGAKARATFPSRFPLMRLDHILVSDDIEVLDAQVIADPRARIASDHLPLMATVRL
ncbi:MULTISPECIES: endonuclease/exonuclease/phosphatase family protein [Pseudorhizobium]|uniref:endonuclease/exonuclease/phosphatase family protein n=1 Tax=Pseudorhizobium TaxID=1903858 RepID=UPI0006907721|nr:endonuclease/exonuclease/phosphatase family protein [Pseudorhizobium marinum]MDY6963147.1 endonuclease/exonuclease/phosphatase family protein [Pseudomonadota bacterium]|tara:strand:+ start:224 stop:976 length:753 start_codon:yes stop_codon:yes gene_type:complete